jgi:AbrB family looped-hinge helix DNA binding protein
MTHIVYVDRAGRVVIPKSLRERYGLRAGEALELIEGGAELRLRPRDSHAAVVHAPDGAVEFDGTLPPGFDPVAAVEEVRAARARAGWE